MSSTPLHLFPTYGAKRSISVCFVTLNFSITEGKEFKLGLCSVVALIIGTWMAVLLPTLCLNLLLSKEYLLAFV